LREVVPEGETPSSHLRKLTYDGAAVRYLTGLPAKVRDQIEHELAIIARLEYEAYFLTVADVVYWARSRNYVRCAGHLSAGLLVRRSLVRAQVEEPPTRPRMAIENLLSNR
jgi:error-prone DNA polymerase